MEWDKIHRARGCAKYPCEDVVRFMAKNYYKVSDRGAVKILEIGCGGGANVRYLHVEGFMGYGVDSSKYAIEQANNSMPNVIGFPFTCMPIRNYLSLIESETMNAVIDIEAVYSNPLDQAKKIYSECRRVLKPSGTMLIKHFAAGTSEHLLDDTFMRLITKEEIPDLLGDFDIVSCDLHTRTHGGGIIKEWVIEAIK